MLHYRLLDLATGQIVLRSGTLETVHHVAEDRLLLATATEIEYINGEDGSLINRVSLRSVVPPHAHVTNFGDCRAYFGLTVALDQSDEGEALTIFLDKRTLKPVAQTTLPKAYVLDTYSAATTPLLVKNDPYELIGIG